MDEHHSHDRRGHCSLRKKDEQTTDAEELGYLQEQGTAHRRKGIDPIHHPDRGFGLITAQSHRATEHCRVVEHRGAEEQSKPRRGRMILRRKGEIIRYSRCSRVGRCDDVLYVLWYSGTVLGGQYLNIVLGLCSACPAWRIR